MSNPSRHTLYFTEEATYGITPSTPAMKRFRHTETSLGISKSTSVSNELRPDRQIADFRHGTRQVGGDFGFELSYGSFDDLLEAVLLGTWSSSGYGYSSSFSVDGAENSINDAGSDFIPVVAGQVIKVAGFESEANNGFFTVVSGNASKIVVRENLISESAKPVTLTQIEHLTAGTERRSFSILRHFSDIESADKPFQLFTGVEFNTLSLSLTPGEMITGSFGAIGKNGTLSTTAPAGSALGQPTATKVFDSFTGQLKEGGTVIALVTEMTLSLENGLEPRFVLFSDTTIKPSVGRSNLTGQITVFFENAVMLEKFLNETPTSLEFIITDEAGNSYIFNIPSIKYTGGQPDTSGQSSITLAMPFQAIFDGSIGSQISVARDAAV